MWSLGPYQMGIIGGLFIGLSATTMLIGLGRITGVSGIFARAVKVSNSGIPWAIAISFLIGLLIGAWLLSGMAGISIPVFSDSYVPLVVGGLLVGIGTRLGSGCTSGHGVCGLSRLSKRSMVATSTFMFSGFCTVAVMRLMGWL